jgi:hypothetical protein
MEGSAFHKPEAPAKDIQFKDCPSLALQACEKSPYRRKLNDSRDAEARGFGVPKTSVTQPSHPYATRAIFRSTAPVT